MKVQKNNTPSFGSIPIYSAKLKQPFLLRPFLPVKDVFVSELNGDDLSRIMTLPPFWHKNKQMKYGPMLISKFKNECSERVRRPNKPITQRFFAVETTEQDPNARQIRAIANVNIYADIYLSYLQSLRQKEGSFSLNGAGSCILYLVSRFTKCMQREKFYLGSIDEAMKFYKKHGMHLYDVEASKFEVTRDNLDAFGKKIADKYSITPIADEQKIFCCDF